MKIAIIERIENCEKDKPFNLRYYLDNSFKEIFDELGILLIPVISEKNLEEVCSICDEFHWYLIKLIFKAFIYFIGDKIHSNSSPFSFVRQH